MQDQIFELSDIMPLLYQQTKKIKIASGITILKSKTLRYIAKCSSLDCPECKAKPLRFRYTSNGTPSGKNLYLQLRLEYDKINEFDLNGHYRYATIDHIIPLSKTGTDDLKNKRLLCNVCNTSKSNKLQIINHIPICDMYTLMTYETYIRWYIKVFYSDKKFLYDWTTDSTAIFNAAKQSFGKTFDLYQFNIAYEKWVLRFRTETKSMTKSQKRMFKKNGLICWINNFPSNEFVVFNN